MEFQGRDPVHSKICIYNRVINRFTDLNILLIIRHTKTAVLIWIIKTI
jgi:hypothetical protein